jgi:hypothetical protein
VDVLPDSADEVRGLVDAAGPFIGRDLGIRAQRARAIRLPGGHVHETQDAGPDCRPTHDSEHEVTYNKERRPFVSVSRNGRLLPEVLEVLSLIAQDDLTLATGHVAPEEALMIIREARKRGVQRIILTHPLLGPQYTFMSFDQLREAQSLGAYMEVVGRNLTGSAAERTRVLDAIRLVGPGSTFVSSDSGLTGSPSHTDALAQAAKVLREAGFNEAALAQMFKENPARLIKLPLM